jgi:hypothetical protein
VVGGGSGGESLVPGCSSPSVRGEVDEVSCGSAERGLGKVFWNGVPLR